jgi:adenosylcobinamide-GDP ribazoletransferase
MKRAARALLASFSYFTILPLPRAFDAAPDAYAVAFLPLAGAAVGAVAGFAGAAVGRHAQAPWGAVVAFVLTILLTGAIHVDGFLDSCDALFASATPERRLEILKDPRHGTFALVGMFLAGLVWFQAIASLPPARLPLLLAFSGAAARIAVIPNAWLFPYARPKAVTPAFLSRPPLALVIVLFMLVQAGAYAIAPVAVIIPALAIVLAAAIGVFASRRLGGLTGDAYGFSIVLVEIAILIALQNL